MEQEEKIYSVKEAADFLGWQIWQVQRAIRGGKIRAFRNSARGRWHIEYSDLMKVRKATRIYNVDSMPDNVQC